MSNIKDNNKTSTTGRSVSKAATTVHSMRWAVVGLLTAAAIISYVDRINLASALPEIRKTIPLSAEASGVLLSAFFWTYTLLQVPAGWAVDRYGVRWTFALAFSFWSIVSASTALVRNLPQMMGVRMLLGIGESIVTPGSMCYIRTNFPEKNRGLATGIFMSGTKWGPAIGAPIAAYLVAAYGWRPMFLLTGVGFLFWLIPWFLLVKNGAAGNNRPSNPTPGAQVGATAPPPWGAILSNPIIWGTCLATFCYMYFVYFCLTWMPTYFKERQGLSLTESGWFTFMSFGGMATMAIIGGIAADYLIARGFNAVSVRKSFAAVGFLLAFTEIFGAFTDSPSVTLFLAVFSLSGLGLTTANYWALTQTLMPGAAIGRVAGIQNTAANLAGIASPWLTGIMIQQTGSFIAPLIAIGLWLALGVGCYLFLVREKYALR